MRLFPLQGPAPPDSLSADDPYYSARLEVVSQINRDRLAAGLGAVEFDALASQVGDQHCLEMAAHGYLSHWNLQGLLPYHRYHLAGGRDHIMENLSSLMVLSSQPSPLSTEPEEVQAQLLNAHQRFMDEKPPLDGHLKNVLDPAHTHVGIGLAVVGGRFTMAEEFLNRYADLEPLPEALPAGNLRVQGVVHDKAYGPYYCILLYEGLPKPQTVEELNRTYAYDDMAGQIVARIPPWEMSYNASSGGFRFQVPVRNLGPGYYHMMLWVRRPHRSIPYVLGGPGAYQVDTALGVACAGWVLRAEQ